MKVAFLFSGQLRELELDLFRKSLVNLTKDLDYSIFGYTWKEMGKSLNHKNNLSGIDLVENIDEKISFLFKDFNLLDFGYESFRDFKKKLKGEYRDIFYSKEYDFGTVNSLPQIYTLYKSFELLEKSKLKFDLVFRCRFDSIFIHPIKIFPLKKILSSGKLFNLNFGRAYYPKRIYDIFFGGSMESMNFISTIWDDTPFLVKNNFDNRLDKRDCCRILFLAASINNINVKSFPSRICDVYRNNDLTYSKYLISSHLINLRLNKKNILYLSFILKWFRQRNLSNIKINFYLIQAILLIPLVYVKRLKYLKIS
tara:strand:+ start:1643 stop:2575 length:933 start_codon:yes stop_codon:yes gene_type:complete